MSSCSFFFQAEDGIRCRTVTGVQTCALPISAGTYTIPKIDVLFSGSLLSSPGVPLQRSEERRVGKECRSRGCSDHSKKKKRSPQAQADPAKRPQPYRRRHSGTSEEVPQHTLE